MAIAEIVEVRAAIATCKGRVCQRLDCADELIVLDVQEGQSCIRQSVDLHSWPPHGRSVRIAQLEVDELVCGAISSFDGAGLDNSTIRLICNVTGPVDAVVGAVLMGVIAPNQSYWETDIEMNRRLSHGADVDKPRPTQAGKRRADKRAGRQEH